MQSILLLLLPVALSANDAADKAMETAQNFENQKNYAKAETLYRDLAKKYNSQTATDPMYGNTYAAAANRHLAFMNCQRHGGDRKYFADAAKLAREILTGLRNKDRKKLASMLPCYAIIRNRLSGPISPAEAADWLVLNATPIKVLKQSAAARHYNIAIKGGEETMILPVTRETPGWIWNGAIAVDDWQTAVESDNL
ncbi:MAG: hypothetical protein HY074_08590 [Deltaproteobacteria bacterium]|nr:hypothetical protein [Deltaproteobacteria bacterium]